jgi:hypothetical protein
MPVISRECRLSHIYKKYLDEYKSDVYDFLLDVAKRADVLEDFAKISREGDHSTTDIFKLLNYLKIQLNNRLEHEGEEPNERERLMIKILEDTLPDMIINFCSSQRSLNNMKQMHGKGGVRKSRKRTSRRRKTYKNASRR